MNSLNIYQKSIQLLNDFFDKFNNLCEESDSFLKSDSNKSQEFISLTKCLYDLSKRFVNESNVSQKSNEKRFLVKTSLNELFTNGFDGEQVWQQIQLHNKPIIDLLVKRVANVVANSHGLSLDVKTRRDETIIDSKKSTNNELKEIFSEESNDGTNDNVVVSEVKPPKNVKSVVDDMFFKWHELQDFLNKEDLKEEQRRSGVQELMSEESDEEVDYFQDSDEENMNEDSDDINGREAMFLDFFDGPNDESVVKTIGLDNKESDEEDDEEEDGKELIDTRDADTSDMKDKEIDIDFDDTSSSDSESQPFGKPKQKMESNEDKSEFERIQESFKEKITKQERLNLLDKSWQMSGEISSDKRPENSLLEEHLHFDHTTRPAPLITEETTFKLEDLIRQRVKDNAFDDVVRKEKPREEAFEFRRRITIESEKSKQSLSQIYENEYLKQKQNDKQLEEKSEQIVIKKLMRNLFIQLDSLSNFNYTPRPPQPEIKIINNLPAITVEEVTPLAVSDVQLLAPQEVFNNQRKELQNNEEMTKTDRKRARRLKKTIVKKKVRYNESKEMANKKKIKQSKASSEDTKHLSSSKKFFDKLQEKTNQTQVKIKSKKTNSNSKQSKELKL